MPTLRVILDELENIVDNHPLWPGDTLSHASANECIERGWATRDLNWDFIPTEEGRIRLAREQWAKCH